MKKKRAKEKYVYVTAQGSQRMKDFCAATDRIVKSMIESLKKYPVIDYK